MRYVFVVTALAPGGTLSVMRQFWLRLERRGRVEVISHGPPGAPIPYPLTVTGGRFGGPLRFPAIWIYAFRTFRAALRTARRRSPTVLVPQDSLATGAAVGLAGWLTGTPVLLMEHGTAVAVASDYFWRERIRTPRLRDRLTKPLLRVSVGLLHRLSLRTADRVLVAGEESEQQLRRMGVRAERMDRYHFAVDLERFRPSDPERRRAARARWALAGSEPVLVSVSRLAPEKGLDLVVDALAGLPEADRPLLVLAGDGPEREALAARAVRAGVAARFLGAIDDAADVASVLAAADLFVYAGRQGTNTPYAVLEAMAAGLAVIASTEPAVHAAMLADGRGEAVPAGNVEALRAAVDRFVATPRLRDEAGRRAREYVERHHAPSVLDRELALIFGVEP